MVGSGENVSQLENIGHMSRFGLWRQNAYYLARD